MNTLLDGLNALARSFRYDPWERGWYDYAQLPERNRIRKWTNINNGLAAARFNELCDIFTDRFYPRLPNTIIIGKDLADHIGLNRRTP